MSFNTLDWDLFNAESNEIPYALFDYMMEHYVTKKHKIYFDYGTEKLDAKYLPYQDLVTLFWSIKIMMKTP